MPIETPSRPATPTVHRAFAEFILCENFAFRPTSVDGFLHRKYDDGSAITMVNFKSYTQSVPDPERRLFNFLIAKLKPQTLDEIA
jgi:hypothetical protein